MNQKIDVHKLKTKKPIQGPDIEKEETEQAPSDPHRHSWVEGGVWAWEHGFDLPRQPEHQKDTNRAGDVQKPNKEPLGHILVPLLWVEEDDLVVVWVEIVHGRVSDDVKDEPRNGTSVDPLTYQTHMKPNVKK